MAVGGKQWAPTEVVHDHMYRIRDQLALQSLRTMCRDWLRDARVDRKCLYLCTYSSSHCASAAFWCLVGVAAGQECLLLTSSIAKCRGTLSDVQGHPRSIKYILKQEHVPLTITIPSQPMFTSYQRKPYHGCHASFPSAF